MVQNVAQDEVPCLVCGEPYKFLHPNHLQTHSNDEPQDVEEYVDWFTAKYNIDPDNPAFESRLITVPEHWHERGYTFVDDT
jgi:predicted transcriptional regulator